MGRLGIAIIVVSLLVAACTNDGDNSVFGCETAPGEQRHSASPFPLSVSENPALQGTTIDLNIGSTITQSTARSNDLYEFDRGVTGYGSTWQCWNGSEWVNTHLLVHNGETLAGEPGVTTTVPAVGLLIPDSFSVIIPDVEPGWYRIKADVFIPLSEDSVMQRVGHVTVEVVGSSKTESDSS